MQSAEIREKHNLEGSCVTDLVKSACCLCCTIVQAEKESKMLLGEGQQHVVKEQYVAQEGMVMPGKQ